MQRKKQTETMASEDRLSALPESILLYILSLLPERKEIVRSSVLSKTWRFLWKSVPLSLVFRSDSRIKEDICDFVSSIARELQYWRYCHNIRTIKFCVMYYHNECIEDIDLLVHFATKVANIEYFSLVFAIGNLRTEGEYEFPQYAYDNSSWKNLKLDHCVLNPESVNWSRLVSLSLCNLDLTEVVMEKVLSGCPNLECLEIDDFWDIYRLEINSKKLRKLILKSYLADLNKRLVIVAPYVQYLELYGELYFRLRNGDSLVTVDLDVQPTYGGGIEQTTSSFYELLQSVAHVENVELGYFSIQFLSGLELKGWQSPPSNWKSLKILTGLEQVNFSGICNILRDSLDLETLDIEFSNWGDFELVSDFTTEDEQSRWFQSYSLECLLLHLKTINIVQLQGPVTVNEFVLALVQYLLKNAKVLKELFISDTYKGNDESEYYDEMAEELLSFPRSSPYASVVFKY